MMGWLVLCFFFSSRRRHTRSKRDWSSDVCSSDLRAEATATLAEQACQQARARFEPITGLLAKIGHAPPSTAESCDKAEHAAGGQISALIDRRNTRKTT